MTEYNFTLKYRLADDDGEMDDIVERLGEAGCTDALVGIGVAGRMALEFSRDATTAREAVRSAVADVKSAVPTASLIEAAPDFVGLTDVAEMVGVTRQSMRKLMVAHADFPPPVHDGSVALWHLADVLGWLVARKGYGGTRAMQDTAQATLEINLAKDGNRRREVADAQELERLFA